MDLIQYRDPQRENKGGENQTKDEPVIHGRRTCDVVSVPVELAFSPDSLDLFLDLVFRPMLELGGHCGRHAVKARQLWPVLGLNPPAD